MINHVSQPIHPFQAHFVHPPDKPYPLLHGPNMNKEGSSQKVRPSRESLFENPEILAFSAQELEHVDFCKVYQHEDGH